MITLGKGRDGRWALLRDGMSPTHASVVGTLDDWAKVEPGLRAHNSVSAGEVVFKANELGGWKAWSTRARAGDVVVLTTLEAQSLADSIRQLTAFGRDGGDRPDMIAGKFDDDDDDPVDALRVLLVSELHQVARDIGNLAGGAACAVALHEMADRIARARVS